MVRNEKGFTFPLTFIIILLVSVLLTIQLEQYLSEKRLMRESELIMKQEYYFLSSVMAAENHFMQMGDDDELPSGVRFFSDGEVEYNTEKLTDSLFKVTFDLKMESLPMLSGYGYYDKEEGKMIKWIEKN